MVGVNLPEQPVDCIFGHSQWQLDSQSSYDCSPQTEPSSSVLCVLRIDSYLL